jgi:hypothetical protein
MHFGLNSSEVGPLTQRSLYSPPLLIRVAITFLCRRRAERPILVIVLPNLGLGPHRIVVD